ncbi:uncharacterized protein LOC121858021, partial [Homarus americanus]
MRDVMLGQDEFLMPYSLSGRLSQVNLWSRVMTQEEILDMANCKVNPEGDVISWSGRWVTHNLERKEVALKDLCRSISRGRSTVPLPTLRYHHAVQLCKGLKGFITTPTNRQDLLDELVPFENMG